MVESSTVQMLGAFGSKGKSKEMTCLQVSNSVVIDAGNIFGLKEEALDINHIFLTHTHLDHIIDIPFLIDTFYDKRTKPLIIYSLKENIKYLQDHLFNWNIWPDFTSINIKNSNEKSVKFQEIFIGESITVDNCTLKPIKTNHTDSSCGYVIKKDDNSIFFTSDTYKCPAVWDEVNTNKSIKSLIIEISFPSRFEQLAEMSKHLTPKLLKEELQNLKRDDVTIYINHLKAAYASEIKKECDELGILLNNGQVLTDGDIIDITNPNNNNYKSQTINTFDLQNDNVKQLLDIGNALTSQRDVNILMEQILLGAKQLSQADGGTLYIMTDDAKYLKFTVVQTDSLNIKMGGTNETIKWQNLSLTKEDGTPNKEQVAVLCAIEGTKKFDKKTGYRTKSMLVIPMRDYDNNIIGVIQLLNKKDISGKTIDFTTKDEELIISMSSQAAVSLTNTKLITELENLLYAFIKSIAFAIGEKSKYTGDHIDKVAILSSIIAEAINDDKTGTYKDTNFTQDELVEINIASWMHDIGKITTPEYIVDKATKLETIYDRINFIEAKFEILKRDIKIQYLENKIQRDSYDEQLKKINDDINFIKNINIGGEFLSEDKIDKIKNISKYNIKLDNKDQDILNENEIYNLSITRGTLTQNERDKINDHVVVSYNMLKELPFPKKFKNIPIIAGSHHKKVTYIDNNIHDGYGAPEIMELPMDLKSKILAVADVFEAITSSNRPYRKPNSLNQSVNILYKMAKDGSLDKDLVEFFVNQGLALKYGKDNLYKSQLDKIKIDENKE